MKKLIVVLLALTACSLSSEPGDRGQDGFDGVDGAPGNDGVNGAEGAQGPEGEDGPSGADGLNCWDTNGDGVCQTDPLDPENEDLNGDALCTIADCAGPQGPPGQDATGLWQQNGLGDIYYLGGKVGIGTASPTRPLDIIGSDTMAVFQSTTTQSRVLLLVAGGVEDTYVANNAGRLVLETGGQPHVNILPDGSVGVGTTAPEQALHVENGNIMATGTNGSGRLVMRGTGPGGHQYEWYPDNPNVGDLALFDRTAVLRRITILGTGNVGIGTAAPAATLDVNGTARLARYSSPPLTCDSAHDGTIALTTLYYTCVCNGGASHWVRTSDGVATCSNWP